MPSFENHRRRLHAILIGLLLSILGPGIDSAAAPSPTTPEWIWHPTSGTSPGKEETVYFRKSFRTPPLIWNSRLTMTADDEAEVFLNGVSIGECKGWDQPMRAEVTVRLNQGENVLGIRARNRGGAAGILVHLNLGGTDVIVSDRSWLVSTNADRGWSTFSFNAARWTSPRVIGPLGIAPWGDVFARPAATPAESIKVKEGFRIELVRSAEPGEGSWICLAFDPQGRAIVSPEGAERPLLRLTLSGNQVTRVEPVSAPIRYAMGLLFAHDSLYANAKGPDGFGLYRLIDANRNDRFETNELHLLKTFTAGSEHGYHALALGPDERIYVLNGNSVKVPDGLSIHSPHRNYGEDVLSLNPDEHGAAGGTKAPEGFVLRTDPEGKEWELWMGGLRNSYGFDFNSDGELFTFDSDMEWDWGTPWYRPTRVLHCVSAGEYGWRNSTRSWPEYYEDGLPSAVAIGIGSPTGVKFGTKSSFPERYRHALFIQDWSYGRILAVHLEPHGASYKGTFENFVQGRPLNLTSLAFAPDGAMYFTTGGRGTQSGLYRVTYVGKESRNTSSATNAGAKRAATARDLRRQLETFHGHDNPRAVAVAWPQLRNADRWVRYAARIAIEHQPLERWRDRLLAENDPTAALTAALALARVGSSGDQTEVAKTLTRFPLNSLTEEQKLLKLRVLEVSLVRHGPAALELAPAISSELNRSYPAGSWPLNRELARLLISLRAPGVVAKTLELIQRAPTQEQQLHFVAQLRNVRDGWTTEERQLFLNWWLRPRENQRHPAELLGWFADVGRTYVDGAGFDNYLRDFRREAVASLSPDERSALATLIEAPIIPAQLLPVSPRKFVREWKMSDFPVEVGRPLSGRDFKRGQQAFVDAQCLSCHRFGNDGSGVGPELTAAGSKYTRRDILESILEPSKVVSEQYQNTTTILKDGNSITGRLISEAGNEIVIETDRVSGSREKIQRQEVVQIRPASLSPMPEGLINNLTKEEILDLLAYLESGGNSDAPMFRKSVKR